MKPNVTSNIMQKKIFFTFNEALLRLAYHINQKLYNRVHLINFGGI